MIHFLLSIVPIEETTPVEIIGFLQPGEQSTLRWSPSSIIPPSLVEDFEIMDDFNIDISFYLLNPDSENFTLIKKLATDIPNNGTYKIMVPSTDELGNASIGLFGICMSDIFRARNIRDRAINELILKIKVYSTIGPILSPLIRRSECSKWLNSEPENIGEIILRQLPPCPTNLWKALRDTANFHIEDRITGKLLQYFFHPGALSCFRNTIFSRFAINLTIKLVL